MKKTVLIFFGLLFLCASYAQQINQTMVDPDIESEILIGTIDETGLQNSIFVEEWNLVQEEYTTEKITIKQIKKYFRKNKDARVDVFFASWCGDSQEHVPHFVKLAKKAKIKDVSYIALSGDKSLPDKDISSFQIEYVPTFIVYKNDQELGRIIESPEISLEMDLLKIISQ